MQAARLFLLGIAILTLIAACWLTGCGGAKADIPPASQAADSAAAQAAPAVTPTSAPAKTRPPRPKPVDPIVVLHTSVGDIQVQLFREKAPRSVDNFLRNYAERQFYDGTIFHHVEAGSMVIGGGYAADLTPKETRSPVFNESQNGLKNARGTVAMIRDLDNAHSATSQFFINVADNPALDCRPDEIQAVYEAAGSTSESPADDQSAKDEVWGYCVFGEVISGMDVVERIAHAPVTSQGDFAKVPAEPITIQSVEQIR